MIILSGEKAEEYKRLYAQYATAMGHSAALLASRGIESPEFQQADAAAGVLWAKLRELQGASGHWMA